MICRLCGSDNVKVDDKPILSGGDTAAFCVDCGATLTHEGEWYA